MPFIGFCETLPFKGGDTVIIPKGTRIQSMNPGRDGDYVAGRTFKVIIKACDNGTEKKVHWHVGQEPHRRREYPHAKTIFERFDTLMLDRKTDPDPVRSGESFTKAYNLSFPISNPKVVWAGTGGYWCEAEVNDILEANGIKDPYPDATIESRYMTGDIETDISPGPMRR
jgi:hypothetical protein